MGRVPSAATEATVLLELADGAAASRTPPPMWRSARRCAPIRSTATRPSARRATSGPRKARITLGVADVAARARRGARARRSRTASCSRATWSTSRRTSSIRSSSRAAPRRLRKLGVGVEILDVKAMRKLGMGALLGVGQGSTRDSRLVVMRWNGGKQGNAAARLHRQGRVLRHRRHLDQAGRRHGGHEGRHGGRGLRRRADARARRPQGQGQCDRRDRPGREHAGRQCAAARRHRHLDVGPDHRDHQHRRRRPARARRRAPLRQHDASSRSSWSISRP